MKSILLDFKQFIMKGDVVGLAVAVVIGAAFTEIVTALTDDFITPLISSFYGEEALVNATFTLNGAEFAYGDFISKIIYFLIVALVVFFLVVRPVNHLRELAHSRKKPEDPTTKICPECLSEIPKKAKRCAFCTAKLSK